MSVLVGLIIYFLPYLSSAMVRFPFYFTQFSAKTIISKGFITNSSDQNVQHKIFKTKYLGRIVNHKGS